jgi:hypothetical protein
MTKIRLVFFIFLLSLLSVIVVSGISANETSAGELGYYRIHCNTDGAGVYFNEDYMGETSNGLLDVAAYPTGTPYTSFTLKKEGYDTYTGPILSVPGKDRIINIYVTMNARPVTGNSEIHLLASPPGSDVFFDGLLQGQVPDNGIFILHDVKPGSHLVQVSKTGHHTETKDLLVGSNEIQRISITLSPLRLGTISVTSDPSGGRVSIDSRYRGITPLSLEDVPEGMHTVIVSTPGYQDFITDIVVRSSGTPPVHARLIPEETVVPGNNRIPVSAPLIPAALLILTFLCAIYRK